jgi:hypothetical protein
MENMIYKEFIEIHREILMDYWNHIAPKLMSWKSSYQWPKGVYLIEAIARCNQLESAIKNDLQAKSWLTKQVFDDVMKWGFGRPSSNSEDEIRIATQEAFDYLRQKRIFEAALAMTKLTEIGISRASKVLALSNQSEFGIYDSRSAHGLSELLYNGCRLIPIPPGRVIAGDSLSKTDFCRAFEKYTWVLTFLWGCAQANDGLREHFGRVSDLEIAFFAKSRAEAPAPKNYQPPSHIKGEVELDEGDCYWTLGVGKKARPFWAYISEEGIKVLTGPKGKTDLYLTNQAIESCLMHFRTAGWFPLGNQIDAVKPNGLGEYFQNIFKKGPKFASHFAAILVNQRRLIYRYGERNMVELKVV